MENMGSIIKKHNKKILSNTPAISDDGCNCRSKDQCPIENKCLSSALVYNAAVTTNDSSPTKVFSGFVCATKFCAGRKKPKRGQRNMTSLTGIHLFT